MSKATAHGFAQQPMPRLCSALPLVSPFAFASLRCRSQRLHQKQRRQRERGSGLEKLFANGEEGSAFQRRCDRPLESASSHYPSLGVKDGLEYYYRLPLEVLNAARCLRSFRGFDSRTPRATCFFLSCVMSPRAANHFMKKKSHIPELSQNAGSVDTMQHEVAIHVMMLYTCYEIRLERCQGEDQRCESWREWQYQHPWLFDAVSVGSIWFNQLLSPTPPMPTGLAPPGMPPPMPSVNNSNRSVRCWNVTSSSKNREQQIFR